MIRVVLPTQLKTLASVQSSFLQASFDQVQASYGCKTRGVGLAVDTFPIIRVAEHTRGVTYASGAAVYPSYCREGAGTGLTVYPLPALRFTEHARGVTYASGAVVYASYSRSSGRFSFTMYSLTTLGYPENCGTQEPLIYREVKLF